MTEVAKTEEERKRDEQMSNYAKFEADIKARLQDKEFMSAAKILLIGKTQQGKSTFIETMA